MKTIVGCRFCRLYAGSVKSAVPEKAVGFLDGHYLATYVNGSTLKTRTINNGKITTGDKGSLLLGQ